LNPAPAMKESPARAGFVVGGGPSWGLNFVPILRLTARLGPPATRISPSVRRRPRRLPATSKRTRRVSGPFTTALLWHNDNENPAFLDGEQPPRELDRELRRCNTPTAASVITLDTGQRPTGLSGWIVRLPATGHSLVLLHQAPPSAAIRALFADVLTDLATLTAEQGWPPASPTGARSSVDAHCGSAARSRAALASCTNRRGRREKTPLFDPAPARRAPGPGRAPSPLESGSLSSVA
jgi:hypothetical protein